MHYEQMKWIIIIHHTKANRQTDRQTDRVKFIHHLQYEQSNPDGSFGSAVTRGTRGTVVFVHILCFKLLNGK